MTGPEHYREAESLLIGIVSPHATDEGVSRALAAAQVHATLAHAAATAMNDGSGGMGASDWDDWRETVSAGWVPVDGAS